jgi:hypothetical protein
MFSKLYGFFTSLQGGFFASGDGTQDACKVRTAALDKAHSLFVINKIKLVYEDIQPLLQTQVADLQWHAQFVGHQKRIFAAMDNVDLCLGLTNSTYEKTLKQWLYYIYKIIPKERESLAQYSQQIASENQDYAAKFNEFKQDDQPIKTALNRIKLIIESTQWEAVSWDSNTMIIIGDKKKKIPDYAFQIYELCSSKSTQPRQLLEEIHGILQNMIEALSVLPDCSEKSSDESFYQL